MSKIKILYHKSDPDGQCSGAIAKLKYPEADLIGLSHSDIFDFSSLKEAEKVIMLDFAFQPFTEMQKIYTQLGENFIWIDHHKSAINEARELGISLTGLLSEEKAACELAWEYFFPDKPQPKVVHFLGRYDVWDHRQPEVADFQYGFQINNLAPENQDFWSFWLTRAGELDFEKVISDGQLITKYQKQVDARICQSNAFETSIDNYSVLVLNQARAGSKVFDSVPDLERYDLLVIFNLNNKGLWSVSFYSTKEEVDCSKIARRFGGGGHRGASGASFKNFEDLPFKIKV